jgi:integral membrane sensor domain MASE1
MPPQFFCPLALLSARCCSFGFPSLPGIFFGSYLLNVLIGYAVFEQQITAQAIANAVLIATVSTLQAAVGGWLFRFKLSFRSVTLISRHNLLLLSAWAPLICLTSATLSVTGLWLLNTVSTAAFLTNWLNWWIGDTFGVLVLLPWMLFFLPADVQIKKWTQQMLHNNARLH